jgi:hypothetical protein
VLRRSIVASCSVAALCGRDDDTFEPPGCSAR